MSNCSLLGGETAEHQVDSNDKYDLAFCVGVKIGVDKASPIRNVL